MGKKPSGDVYGACHRFTIMLGGGTTTPTATVLLRRFVQLEGSL